MCDRETIPAERLTVSAYTVPTDFPESDGTLEWDSTSLILVEIEAGGKHGLGYTYADGAIVGLIRDKLAEVVVGRDVLAIPAAWIAMVQAIRNLGRPGLASMAIAAVDSALWDLKGRLLGLPLVSLLGAARPSVSVYGSGGFTSYSVAQLQEQLGNWTEAGFRRVKMKVGREPEKDAARVMAARARPLAQMWNCSSMPTALTQASKRWPSPSGSRTATLPGSRSRFRRTISTACVCCAIAALLEWTSPPASTATTCPISAAWWKRRRSMCFKPTQRAARESPAFCRSGRCARHSAYRCRPILLRRCTCSRAVLSVGCVTWSISTTMPVSSGCCLMGR